MAQKLVARVAGVVSVSSGVRQSREGGQRAFYRCCRAADKATGDIKEKGCDFFGILTTGREAG